MGSDERDGEVERLRQRLLEQEYERHGALAHRMAAVCRFAENVAGDLDEIALSLVTHANLLVEELGEMGPGRGHASRVQSSTRRLLDLARRLRELGGPRVARVELVELNEVVERFVLLVRRALPQNVELDFIPGHRLATITADPLLIEQLLLNLCINSRDAMPRGGRITIETENVVINGKYRESHPWASPGRYVLLSVTDDGIGMSKDVRDRAFEPFFTTKARGRGVGLGLATAYGIVQSHRGMIHLYSELARGTTFKVYLPAVARRADDVGDKITGAVPGGSETVLVAEDEDEVRRALSRLLVTAGYSVLEARDGDEAVRVFGEHADRISLVVMDVAMPNLDGRGASERIRTLRPDAKILFASGSPGRQLGADPELSPLLDKPYEPDRLLRAIRGLIDDRARA